MNSDLRSRANKQYRKKVYFQTSKLHTSHSDRVINRNSNMSLLQKEKESIAKLIGEYDIQSGMKNAVSSILIQIKNLKKDKDNNRRYVLKKNNKIDLHSENSIPNSIKEITDNYKAKGYKDTFVNNQTTLFDAHPLLTTNKNDLLVYCQAPSQAQSQSQSISSKIQAKDLSTTTESLFKGNKYINYLKNISETIEQKQTIADSTKQIKQKETYNKREYHQLDNDIITDWKTKEIMNDNYISEVIGHIDDNNELLDYKLFSHRFNGMNKCRSTDSIIHSQRSNKTSKGHQLMMMMKNKNKATCKFTGSLSMSKMSGIYNKTSIRPLAQTNSKTIDIKSDIKKSHTIKRGDIKPLSNDEELYKLYETERKKRANCDDVISFFTKSNNKEIKQMLSSPFSEYFPLYTQRIINHHKEHKLLNWMEGEFSESELRSKFRKTVSTISELNTKLSSFNSTGSSIFHHH